jgi:hypothetical protein
MYRTNASATALANCLTCPSGAYCPTGAASPTLCRRGTYNPQAAAKSLANCSLCAPGTYAPDAGRNSTCPICDEDSYCRTPLTREACPLHTSSPPGSYSKFQCDCNAGFNCTAYLTLQTVVVLRNTSLYNFTQDINGIKTAFIAAVAQAAGVSPSHVTITGVVEHSGLRQLDGSPHPPIHVLLSVRGPLGTLVHPGTTLLGGHVVELEEVTVVPSG